MLIPLEHHTLLLFWVQILVLFVAARGLGLLAQRVGQPAVVGELAAGLVIGPSLLGKVWPAGASWLFPGDELHSGLILAVAWIGVILLLIETGLETDLQLLSRIGRSTAVVPIGSLVLPLALGIGMGFVLPDTFLSEGGGRPIFAMFMGVCLAVSSLPVVAKILIELNLMRRNVGQIIIVAGMADDLVGWVMLSTLAGVVGAQRFQADKLAITLVAIAAFIAFSFTYGQRLTNALLRRARSQSEGIALSMSAVMLVVFAYAALTQAIGIEAVFGAFVAGIILGRSRFFRREYEETIHAFSHGVFAPIFFATAGMYVDLGQLRSGEIALWAVIVILVASFGKLAGSYVGARVGPLSHREAIAVGVGLNARGALEVIIATIALSLGVFNAATYTVIVLLAMTTSIAAPPLLRWALGRVEASAEEAQRLEREELLASSVIANARSALLPTRGGANSLMAARMLDLVLQPDASVTVLTVQTPDDHESELRRSLAEMVRSAFEGRATETRREVSTRPVAEAILAEARLGYDLVAVGLTEDFRGTHELSEDLQRLLASTRTPVLLVRRPLAPVARIVDLRFRRILVPVTGTHIGTAAEEIAYVLGTRLDADVDAVHVVGRHDGDTGEIATHPPVEEQLRRTRNLGERFGRGATTLLRRSAVPYQELLTVAAERGTDLLVLGTQVRTHEGHSYLGHGTEFLLEHAPQCVAVVVFPGATR